MLLKNMKNFSVIIVAAGEGQRFGGTTPKQFLPLAGKCPLSRSVETFAKIETCTRITVVISPVHRTLFSEILSQLPASVTLVDGGPSRRDSVHNGLLALKPYLSADDLVLIHDAARPLVSPSDIQKLHGALSDHQAASLAKPVADTLCTSEGAAIDRTNLWALQTPQGFHFGPLLKAHELHSGHFTDDTGLLRESGIPVHFVIADHPNFKITTPEDFIMAEHLLKNASSETRIGSGYDVHAFDTDTNVSTIRLCGLDIPFSRKLAGHSDADVALHALTDAILGAIGEGDIGLHFPPSDMTYKNMDSALFLKRAIKLMESRGGNLINADLTLICEAPKIGPHRDAMRARVAEICEVSAGRINIKATTTEKLGFTGRGEGIAAQANVSITLPKA